MGRSVSYPSDALVVFAQTPRDSDWCSECSSAVDECECHEDDRNWLEGETDWDWLKEDMQGRIQNLFPSFYDVDEWIGREDHVLARNSFVRFGVSEYCGLMSIWLVVRDDLESAGLEALAEQWIKAVASRFRKEFGELVKVGSFSNGEGVYRRVAA